MSTFVWFLEDFILVRLTRSPPFQLLESNRHLISLENHLTVKAVKHWNPSLRVLLSFWLRVILKQVCVVLPGGKRMNHENRIFCVLKCAIKISAKVTLNSFAWWLHKLCGAGHAASLIITELLQWVIRIPELQTGSGSISRIPKGAPFSLQSWRGAFQ